MKTRVALIPSYEPSFVLLDIVKELIKNDFQVVVVNDGSKESFDEVFNQLPEEVNYLHYKTNKGKGYALKYGMSYIKDHFDKDIIVVTLDSDGQHRVSDAIKICDRCEKESDCLILGSRKFDKKTPSKSRFGNFMARTTFLISTHHKIYDTQTGLRAFSAELLPAMIAVKGNRYEYEMNVLLEMIRQRVIIREVKITTIYIDNNAGTHYNPFKDTMKIFKEVIKFSASSLIGFLIDYGLYSLLVSFKVEWAHWVLICDILARIVSASINFTINYHLVFKKREKFWLALIKYAGLAAFILGCNVLLLWLLNEQAGINEYLAKIIVEVTLFITSWIVQRLFVFRRNKRKKA